MGQKICYCWFQETTNVKQKNKNVIRFIFVFTSEDGEAVPAYPFPSMSTLPEMDWPNICSPGLMLRPDSFWNKWWQPLNNIIWRNCAAYVFSRFLRNESWLIDIHCNRGKSIHTQKKSQCVLLGFYDQHIRFFQTMVKFGVYLDLLYLCQHLVDPGAILFPYLLTELFVYSSLQSSSSKVWSNEAQLSN